MLDVSHLRGRGKTASLIYDARARSSLSRPRGKSDKVAACRALRGSSRRVARDLWPALLFLISTHGVTAPAPGSTSNLFVGCQVCRSPVIGATGKKRETLTVGQCHKGQSSAERSLPPRKVTRLFSTGHVSDFLPSRPHRGKVPPGKFFLPHQYSPLTFSAFVSHETRIRANCEKKAKSLHLTWSAATHTHTKPRLGSARLGSARLHHISGWRSLPCRLPPMTPRLKTGSPLRRARRGLRAAL